MCGVLWSVCGASECADCRVKPFVWVSRYCGLRCVVCSKSMENAVWNHGYRIQLQMMRLASVRSCDGYCDIYIHTVYSLSREDL